MGNLEKIGVFTMKQNRRWVNIEYYRVEFDLEGRVFYARNDDNSVERIFVEVCPKAVETIINRQNFNQNYNLIVQQSEIIICDAFNAFLNYKMMQRCIIKKELDNEYGLQNWYRKKFGKNRDQT